MTDPVTFARQRIETVGVLAKRFGERKLNLLRPGTTSREGIWCVPLTAPDLRKMLDDNSHDEQFHVYLANMPLPWGGRCWGAEVIGVTRGRSRPEALPEHQAPLDDEVFLLYEGLRLIDEETKHQLGNTDPPATVH